MVVGGIDVLGVGSVDGCMLFGVVDGDYGFWVVLFVVGCGVFDGIGMIGVVLEVNLLLILVGFGVVVVVLFIE